jgi:hypothetical protein
MVLVVVPLVVLLVVVVIGGRVPVEVDQILVLPLVELVGSVLDLVPDLVLKLVEVQTLVE